MPSTIHQSLISSVRCKNERKKILLGSREAQFFLSMGHLFDRYEKKSLKMINEHYIQCVYS